MRIARNLATLVIGCTVISGLNMLAPSDLAGQVNIVSGFGNSAGANTASNCPSFCTGDFDFDNNGGEFAGNASAISTTYGLSQSRAYYSSEEFFLPELKAFSSSTGGQGGSATAFGVQGFAFEGTESEVITIDFTLDANVIDSGSFGDESVGASIGALLVDSFNPDQVFGPEYYGDFGTWYFENTGLQLGTDSAFVNTPNGTDAGSISFSVNPGDVFFVAASLSASSRTGTADAFNTLTTSFADPVIASQLSIANPVSAVPEPGSLVLLPMIAVGLIAHRRKN